MFRTTILVILVGLLTSNIVLASNIIEVLPLTDQILLVHFDDGYVRHHERGEERSNEWVIGTPLNVMVASSPTPYSLTSTTDVFYTNPQSPVSVGRKSKGTDFTWLCEGWSFQNFFGVEGCNNTSEDHAKEHWIYLRLPSAMETGGSYTLNTANLSEGSNTFTFTFNENELRSEAIHVNNLGYTPDASAKYAYVYHWMGDLGGLDLSDYEGNDFHLLDTETGNIVYTDQLTFRKAATTVETLQNNPNETPAQNFLGADVYECDFSDFATEGSYRLVVSGIGASFPFEIACDAYRPAYRSTMRGLFMNRSGIELTAEHTDWPRPAPHHPQLTPGFAGKLIYTTTTQVGRSSAIPSGSITSHWVV
ncbi:MAG: cellulase N-terminal Ig-like domain-containing protein, partial [Bacteroidota bacterium]